MTTYCTVCPDWEIKHPERCSNTLVHDDNKLYFCTKRCKERFLKAPEDYTGANKHEHAPAKKR